MDATISAYHASEPIVIVPEPYPKPDSNLDWMVARVKGDPKPLPADLPIIIGDVVHNLRSSLDHLAWQAVGAGTQTTAFPIWRGDGQPTPKQLKDHVKEKLKGSLHTVIDAVIALEPYSGGKGDLLWKLHQLDIYDKHRLLIPVVSVNESVGFDPTAALRRIPGFEDVPSMPISLRPADRPPLKDGVELFIAPIEHFDQDYKLNYTVELVFQEPKAVKGKPISILKQISKATKDVVSTVGALI